MKQDIVINLLLRRNNPEEEVQYTRLAKGDPP